MPRKTREQKIIADLRKQLRLRAAANPEVKTSDHEVSLSQPISLPEAPVQPMIAKKEVNYGYLKRDMLKVGALVGVSLLIEVIVSYLVTSGSLKSWGIS